MIVNYSVQSVKMECFVYEIGVYDRFGDKTLSKSQRLDTSC